MNWLNFLKGRWHSGWINLQNDYYNSIPKDPKITQNGNIWAINIIISIWNSIYELWIERNEVVHGHDTITKEQRRYGEALRQTQQLYTLRNKVCPNDKKIFHKNIDEHLEHHNNSSSLIQWLNTWEAAITTSTQQAQKHNITMTSTIGHYFKQDG